jgi:hypothetical protein
MKVSASAPAISFLTVLFSQVYICDTPIEILVALQAHDRESHLKPLPTPDLAQFSTRLADFILRDSASIACKTRTTLTELLGDDKTPLSEVLSPTLVVTTLEGSYGCHYRISDSVADMIFMSRSIWEQWQAALTRQTKDFHALQVVVTATILHEIAHRCISLASL